MKSTTLAEALVETLSVSGRLIEWKLISFTQLRFQRDTKAAKPPSKKDVVAELAKAVKKGAVVKLENRRYELEAKLAVKLAAKRRAARGPAPAPLPKERCIFPAQATDAFERARAAVEARFEVFAANADAVSFRWRHRLGTAGPDFRLTRESKRAEAVRPMRPWQRSVLGKATPPFVTFLVLAFDDLEAVLDEINGLIEAQNVVGKATGGPMFLAWNKKMVAANGDDLGPFSVL